MGTCNRKRKRATSTSPHLHRRSSEIPIHTPTRSFVRGCDVHIESPSGKSQDPASMLILLLSESHDEEQSVGTKDTVERFEARKRRWDRSAHFDLQLRRIESWVDWAALGSEAAGHRMCVLQLLRWADAQARIGSKERESKATPGDARERRVEIPTCICTQRVAWREARRQEGKRRVGLQVGLKHACALFRAPCISLYASASTVARPPPSSRLSRSRRVGQVADRQEMQKSDLLKVRRVA